tara:strand:+ start:160 stop:345 length:186 start_codon:yes stop_codon:yes gene_type:complete
MDDKKNQRVLTKQDLISKYEKELNSMVIMDDYDGGKANCMRTVIEDLKSAVCNEADKELDY